MYGVRVSASVYSSQCLVCTMLCASCLLNYVVLRRDRLRHRDRIGQK